MNEHHEQFASALFNAIVRTLESAPYHVSSWSPIGRRRSAVERREPKPVLNLSPNVTLRAVTDSRTWYLHAALTVKGERVHVGCRKASQENADELARLAAAARACRDAGGDAADVRAAIQAAAE